MALQTPSAYGLDSVLSVSMENNADNHTKSSNIIAALYLLCIVIVRKAVVMVISVIIKKQMYNVTIVNVIQASHAQTMTRNL